MGSNATPPWLSGGYHLRLRVPRRQRAGLREPAAVRVGMNPIVTFEKQLLNMIGNLLSHFIKWLSCTAK